MDILERRFQITLEFLSSVLPAPANILDLGIDNPLAERMRASGYTVRNTPSVDLDLEPLVVADLTGSESFDAVTAFEILEHLVNPFSTLAAIQCPRLIASVPLRLWFAKAYKNTSDPFDQHFHEFEPWQFDRLIEKSGWEITATKKWTGPTGQFGLRPLFRRYTPRYYAIAAEPGRSLRSE